MASLYNYKVKRSSVSHSEFLEINISEKNNAHFK